MATPPEPSTNQGAVRVSTLELFFDLIFVFTLTRLTAALADDLSVPGVLRVVLVVGLIMWMYGGYAWLTNAVAPDTRFRRTLVLVGMAGFLGISLAIPDAFGANGWRSRPSAGRTSVCCSASSPWPPVSRRRSVTRRAT